MISMFNIPEQKINGCQIIMKPVGIIRIHFIPIISIEI